MATFPGLAADGEGQSILRESSRPVRQCAWHRLRDLRRHLRRRAEHLEELRPEKLRGSVPNVFWARREESARRLRSPVDGSLTQVNGLTGDAWQSVPTALPGGSGSAVVPWSEYEAIEPQVAEAKNDAAHRGTRPRGSHLDPHQPQQKPHDNTVCPQCRAVYRDRRGRWTMVPMVPRWCCATGVRYGAAALHRRNR